MSITGLGFALAAMLFRDAAVPQLALFSLCLHGCFSEVSFACNHTNCICIDFKQQLISRLRYSHSNSQRPMGRHTTRMQCQAMRHQWQPAQHLVTNQQLHTMGNWASSSFTQLCHRCKAAVWRQTTRSAIQTNPTGFCNGQADS